MNRFGQWLHALPVHRKLMLTILGTSVLSMAIAGMVLYLFLIASLRRNFAQDSEALARISAANSAVPIQFNDRQAAHDILEAVRAEKRVVGALITLAQGQTFCVVGEVDARWRVMMDQPATRWPQPDQLVQLCPIILKGETLGTLALVFDFGPTHDEFLYSYLLVFVVALAGSALVGYALTSRARQMITAPIRELVNVAQLVSRTQNFGLRARRMTGGEVGQLTEAFNDMLQRIKVGEAVAREVQERRRVEDALRESEQRFRTLFDNATIGLFRANDTGGLLMANPALIQMAGFDSFAELAGAHLGGELYAHNHDRTHVQQLLEKVGLVADAELVWRRREGTLITVRLNAKAIRDRDGRLHHIEGSVEDITARKLAEAELDRLHRELLDSSRAAGMAEVATGVLHNVGNVLNSVNVSVTLLHDQLAASRLASLRQAIGLLEQNLGQLGDYLTQDPRGQLLPDFLIRVTEHLGGEQERWQEELHQLRENVEHIKQIVAQQQTLARVAGLIEPLAAPDLLEDAIRLSFTGDNLRILRLERQYAEVPPVLADKHKVLQILVNLLRNAHHAVLEQATREPWIGLRVYLNGSGRVKLQVADNGVGIPPENLTRVFSHGFTTRADGHGFGLHSGALAAQELGGALFAESPGPGRGATFTLELPVADAGN